MAIVLGNLCIKLSAKLGFHVLSHRMKTANVISCCRDYGSSGPVRYIPKKCRLAGEKPFSPPKKCLEEKVNFSDSKPLRERDDQSVKSVPEMLGLDKEYRDQPSFSDRVYRAESVNSTSAFGNTIQSLELNDDAISELEVTDPDLIGELETVDDEIETSFGKNLYKEKAVEAKRTKENAEKVVIEALGRRAYTEVELRKKLHGKKFSQNIIEEVITDCRCRGLINDYLYAESFSRSRWSSSFWGPRRIKQMFKLGTPPAFLELVAQPSKAGMGVPSLYSNALHLKGVDRADSEKATKNTFEDGDHGNDGELRFGISSSLLERLFVQASKQWLRGRDVPYETRKSRIVRWLQYRGFDWSIVSYIVKKLETQHPS